MAYPTKQLSRMIFFVASEPQKYIATVGGLLSPSAATASQQTLTSTLPQTLKNYAALYPASAVSRMSDRSRLRFYFFPHFFVFRKISNPQQQKKVFWNQSQMMCSAQILPLPSKQLAHHE